MNQPALGWGVWIGLYFFLGGVAAGAYFTAALAEVFGDQRDRSMAKVGYYIAFPLALLCAVLLIVDLGRPERFWELIMQPSTDSPIGWALTFKLQSPIQIGGFALAGFGFFSLLSLVDVWVEEGRLKFAPLRAFYNAIPRKLYASLGMLFGFFLAGYTGVLLNTTAQRMWAESNLIGALFLASAASTGAAAIALVMALRNRPEAAEAAGQLTRMDNTAIVIEVVILALVLLTGETLARALLTGPFVLAFLLFLAMGIVVPLAMQIRSTMGAGHLSRGLVAFASMLVLVGGLLMRFMILYVAQT
jgi:formate-dependent nitrite reductase membrane component NrfD